MQEFSEMQEYFGTQTYKNYTQNSIKKPMIDVIGRMQDAYLDGNLSRFYELRKGLFDFFRGTEAEEIAEELCNLVEENVSDDTLSKGVGLLEEQHKKQMRSRKEKHRTTGHFYTQHLI